MFDEMVDVELKFPDGSSETVPIEKDIVLKICGLACLEGKTAEDKFLEIIQELIDEELREQQEG